MKQYLEYLEHVLKNGEERKDRTGTGTIGVFGYQNRYDLQKGFPLMTTKEMNLKAIFYELKWFLNGDTNIKYLVDNGVNIWNPDAYRWFKTKFPNSTMTYEEFVLAIKEDPIFAQKHGELGNIYGKQWRSWNVEGNVIDQIKNVIDGLIHDPYGRRHIVSAWNVGDLDKMALPPCHLLFQFYVSNDGRLSCQLYQRSADSFLGVPYNIASYSFVIHMIGAVTGYKVGEFIHTIGDAHIYLNHQTAVLNQLRRTPRELPILTVEKKDSIFDIEWEDITLTNYNPYPAIRAKVSVGK